MRRWWFEAIKDTVKVNLFEPEDRAMGYGLTFGDLREAVKEIERLNTEIAELKHKAVTG